MIECRRRRSQDPDEALSHYLWAEARRRGARAVALGTPDGLMVSGCGDADLSLLAAAGSMQVCGDVAVGTDQLGRLDCIVVQGSFGRLVLSYCDGSAPRAAVVDRDIDRLLSLEG